MVGNMKVLELLSEEEIQFVCKNADVDIFLKVFRDEKDKNKYKKYTQKLGRLDKKSNMAQTFCPIYAFELYKKGDKAFVGAVSNAAERIGTKFWEAVCIFDAEATVKSVSEYDIDLYVKLYIDISRKWKNITPELFFLSVKINGIVLDENRIDPIKNSIVDEQRKMAEEQKANKKIEDEKKKIEKELLQQFAIEKERLTKEIKKLTNSINQMKVQNEQLNGELFEIRDRDKKNREKLYDELKKQIDKELKIYQKEQEDRINVEVNLKKQSMMQAISDDEKRRKAEISERYDVDISKKEKETEQLSSTIGELQDKVQLCRDEYDDLILKIEEANEERLQLEAQETEYLSNVKKRLLQAELDKSLLSIVSSQNDYGASSKVQISNKSSLLRLSQFFVDETEKSQDVSELEDFVQDFSDNIALSFSNSYEIAAIVISAIYHNKPVIIEESLATYIAGSLSALIDEMPAYIIDANTNEMDSIAGEINSCDGQVIVVNGVLGTFNEPLFSYICNECSNKNIFFTISDIKDVRLFSKSVLNKAIILDIEEDYTFLTHEPLWVGKHDINSFNASEEKNALNQKYEKYFRNLVNEKICSRSGAIELTQVLSSYLRVMSEIGEVLSRSFRYYIDDSVLELDETQKILEKSGWK